MLLLHAIVPVQLQSMVAEHVLVVSITIALVTLHEHAAQVYVHLQHHAIAKQNGILMSMHCKLTQNSTLSKELVPQTTQEQQ